MIQTLAVCSVKFSAQLKTLAMHIISSCTRTLRRQDFKSDVSLLLHFRPSSPSKSIPLDPSTDAGLQSPSTAEITDESGTGRQPNIAAATAVDSDTTTTVIDSIPWGTSGTATTKGQSASPQAGGGGGSITGGTTGGGGSGSSRPSGDSGGGDDGDRSSSSWQQWWVRLLLASGGATAVSLLSSTVREALQSAMITVKSKFAPGNI